MIDPREPDYTNTPVSPKRPAFHYRPLDPQAAPQVSVITPFYNTGEVFHETAACVMGQSFQQWEWIIVNDASTDAAALDVLAQYRGRDSRIRVIDHPANRGVSAARNTGVREARSPFVFKLDADDLIEPTTLEKLLWYLLSHPEHHFVKGYNVGFGAQQYLWTKGFHLGREFLTANLASVMAMVRRDAYQQAGGYDEGLCHGEDWDFWLRCANQGLWGGTVPEYLDWYRRRDNHNEAWSTLAGEEKLARFKQELARRYPRLFRDNLFPTNEPYCQPPFAEVREDLPARNDLGKTRPRLLMILPWLTMGGADKFNVDALEQLTARGWEVTVATTLGGDHSWMPMFARFTPDIFPLYGFLRPPDYPVFLRYLIQSRQPDVVMVSNSELGYLLLPYLRSVCPEPAYVDYCHMEEEQWRNGGYPRLSVAMQSMLDLSLVASSHLKRWMTQRGGRDDRIEVCYLNVDTDRWAPNPPLRQEVRAQYGIAPEQPVLLYPVRLCAQKRPQVFAAILTELSRRGCDFVALVAGDGPMRGMLESAIAEHRLQEKVRMLGSVPSETVRQLMAAADIFLLPSEWEGIALAIYEAMAAGLAVVGADVGGQKELVTPECGFLVPRGDEAGEIAQYVEVLHRLLAEPQLRQEMGRRARQRVAEHFKIDDMGVRLVNLLEQARRLRQSSPQPAVEISLGLACATQAVEYTRLGTVADQLWAARQQPAPSPVKPVQPQAVPVEIYQQLQAEMELQRILNSRTWRAVRRLKGTAAYGWLAQLRYGPDWHAQEQYGSPEQQLAHIRNSRAYRLIQALKANAIYRWYARRKYGDLPPPIENGR